MFVFFFGGGVLKLSLFQFGHFHFETVALLQPGVSPPIGFAPEELGSGRFSGADLDVLRRMSDVFKFGIDGDVCRSCSPPPDSGSDDNFWDKSPTVAPWKNGKTGRGQLFILKL